MTKRIAFVALALTVTACASITQSLKIADCATIAPKEAEGTIYSYNGGLGKQFALQLAHGTAGDKSVRRTSCSSEDREGNNVDCSIKGFSGIMHVRAGEVDSYFRIPQSSDVQIAVTAGSPLKCTVQAAAPLN